MPENQALLPRGPRLPEVAHSPVGQGSDIETQEFDSFSYLRTYWNIVSKHRWTIISDDGQGQHNPDRSEGPRGRAARPARTEVFKSASSLPQSRESRRQQRARRTKVNQCAGKASSESPALKPYGGKPAVRILREAMEAAASFEARSAPLPYPTFRHNRKVAAGY